MNVPALHKVPEASPVVTALKVTALLEKLKALALKANPGLSIPEYDDLLIDLLDLSASISQAYEAGKIQGVLNYQNDLREGGSEGL